MVYICESQCEEYWGGQYGEYFGGFLGCDLRLLTYNSAKFLIVHGGPQFMMLLRSSKNVKRSVHTCFQAASFLAAALVHGDEGETIAALLQSIETKVNATVVASIKAMRELLEKYGINVAEHLRESTLLY